MPPKKHKTRHSSGNIFGPSAELPDDGDLFTLRDILAACERQLELTPGVSNFGIADQISPMIKNKWKQNNPELVLISDIALKNKIARDMNKAQKIRQKKVTNKKKENFIKKLDRLFDLLCCHCPFVTCSSVSCTNVDCSSAHIDCSCLREFKIPVIELEFVKDQRMKVG